MYSCFCGNWFQNFIKSIMVRMIRGFLTSAGRAFSLIFLFRGSQFLGVVWQKACVSQQGAFWGVMCTYKKTVYNTLHNAKYGTCLYIQICLGQGFQKTCSLHGQSCNPRFLNRCFCSRTSGNGTDAFVKGPNAYQLAASQWRFNFTSFPTFFYITAGTF